VIQHHTGLPLYGTLDTKVLRARPEGGWFLEQELTARNLVTSGGQEFIAKRIGPSVIGSSMNHMAVGSGTTAAALGNTALLAEQGRKTLAISSVTGNANVYTAIATFGGNADSVTSVAITEIGVFNHASSGQGTMLARVVQAAVTLAQSDLLHMTYNLNVGSA
jgi:hypothetical protein